MQYLSLGQKLRLKRKELDLTLKDIAGDYISPATLSLVERDLQAPSQDLLHYLAERLNTSVSYFRETPEELLNRRAKTLLSEAEALLHRKRYGMATHFAEEILLDARELKHGGLVCEASLLLGRIALEQGDYHAANDHLFEAQTSALRAGHLEHLPQIYFLFGLVSYRQAFFAQALDYLKQSERAQVEESDLTYKVYTLFSQVYLKKENFDRAQEYAAKAQALLKRMNDLEAYAESLLVQGASAREKGQYEQARDLFQEALRLLRQSDAKHVQSDIEYQLGHLYAQQGEIAKANVHFDQAVAQKQELGDATAVTTALDHVEALIEAQEYLIAAERLEAAMSLLQQFQVAEERARALTLRFQLARLSGGDMLLGTEALEEGLSLIRHAVAPKRLADRLVKLARLCALQGDQAMATTLFAEAFLVYEKMGLLMTQTV
ncbi:MAG TPA: tetratricopeptide repeat protein [Bacilli bacterium]|nr:tetratricopeptide repeat protein [Bacilli bacterium]